MTNKLQEQEKIAAEQIEMLKNQKPVAKYEVSKTNSKKHAESMDASCMTNQPDRVD